MGRSNLKHPHSHECPILNPESTFCTSHFFSCQSTCITPLGRIKTLFPTLASKGRESGRGGGRGGGWHTSNRRGRYIEVLIVEQEKQGSNRIERTEVDDRRPTTNETKMKTMMMLTTWMMLCLLLIGACAQAPPTPQDAPAAPAADAGDQGASGAVDSAETAEKPETIGEDCLPNENNEFVFKVNLWEYQYEVEGCEGVAPTLKIKRGVEYTFVQEDVSSK